MLQRFPLGPSVSKLGPWPRHAHQRSMETPLLLNWQTPSLRRIQIDTDTHTRHRTTDKAVWMCARVCQAHTHTHLHTHGVSHGLSCRQQSSVNWDLFCSPQGTITLLSYLSVFSLSPPSLSYILSMPRPSLIAPPPHPLVCSSSPGWPSVTSTPCLEWLSLSGWLWCLACQRRTSSAVSSWGSFHFWWSRPPRTSWVFGYFFKNPSTHSRHSRLSFLYVKNVNNNLFIFLVFHTKKDS